MPTRRFSGARCRPVAASASGVLVSVMRPAASGSSPATARSRVVLPQPEGPISTPICPTAKPRLTPSTAAPLAAAAPP